MFSALSELTDTAAIITAPIAALAIPAFILVGVKTAQWIKPAWGEAAYAPPYPKPEVSEIAQGATAEADEAVPASAGAPHTILPS